MNIFFFMVQKWCSFGIINFILQNKKIFLLWGVSNSYEGPEIEE